MTIDSIHNGIVIDHIPAGKSMELYRYLDLENTECSVAVLRNVNSSKLGKKDIIKIDERLELNWDVLGFLAPGCTVNLIENDVLTQKIYPSLPERLNGVIRCRNPRCITTIEQGLEAVFVLSDRKKRIYRCLYCESRA